MSVFLSLSRDLNAASTSPTTAAITSAFDLNAELELDPELVWSTAFEFGFGPKPDRYEAEAEVEAAVASANCLLYWKHGKIR